MRPDDSLGGCDRENEEEFGHGADAGAIDIEVAARGGRATNHLAFSVLKWATRNHHNVVFSPIGLAFSLALLAAAARGATREQILDLLHLSSADLPLTPGALRRALAKSDAPSALLTLGSSLWVDESAPLRPSFVDFARTHYRASVRSVDLESGGEDAREQINRWGACETNGRIPEILPLGAVKTDTRVITVSSIYFRDHWTSPFVKDRERDFVTRDSVVRVPFMSQTANLRYAQVPGAELLQLPYVGGLTMLIVLPDSDTGIDATEARLAGEFDHWLRLLRVRRVHAVLPPWSDRARMSLEEPMRALGMSLAFDPHAADFSILAERPIHVQAMLQEAFMSVDERGTEAAALTATSLGFLSGQVENETEDPVFFTADRPFVYFLRDPKSGAIVFAGVLTNPRP